MKNVCIIFLLSIIISLTAFGLGSISSNEGGMYAMNQENACVENEYLRIHIRADSNENEAQAVKYLVRDRVVEYLTPVVAECETKQEALQRLQGELKRISAEATAVLRAQGFSYSASAELTKEQFPTRVYGEYILPAGEYTALILRLGRGEGDNWWCVVYPPLCFAGGENVIYKSKIKEIIRRFYS